MPHLHLVAEFCQSLAGAGCQFFDDLDGEDLRTEFCQHRRLVSAPRANLQHALPGREHRQLGHQGHDVRLADRLVGLDRQRRVIVCLGAQSLAYEHVSRHRAHRLEHPGVGDPAGFDLTGNHALARVCVLGICHRLL